MIIPDKRCVSREPRVNREARLLPAVAWGILVRFLVVLQ